MVCLADGSMRKIQLVVRARPSERHAAFARRIDAEIVPALIAGEHAAIKVVLTDAPPPRLALLPFARAPIAVISVWGSAEVAIEGARAYEVEEALPVAYEKTWRDGEPTPGVCLLTLLSRKRGLDDATFLARWHDGHTPLSLEIHPLWGYSRNVVSRAIDGRLDEPRLDGIVEEQFRERADLLDPRRMYGGALRMLPNMIRVGRDIAGFIDLRAMEVYLATERWIRSPR